MAQFTAIVITYNATFVNGLPTATLTATVPITTDLVTALLNMMRMNGVLLSDGVTFVPMNVIVLVKAQ